MYHLGFLDFSLQFNFLCPCGLPFLIFSFFHSTSLLFPPFSSSPTAFFSLIIFLLLKNFYSKCFLPVRCKLFPTSKYNCWLSEQVAGLFYPYGAFWFELSATLPIMGCTGFWLRKMQQDRWVFIGGCSDSLPTQTTFAAFRESHHLNVWGVLKQHRGTVLYLLFLSHPPVFPRHLVQDILGQKSFIRSQSHPCLWPWAALSLKRPGLVGRVLSLLKNKLSSGKAPVTKLWVQ